MDTRAYSKGYEEYYRRAEKKYGVKYTRCRLSDVKEDPLTNNLNGALCRRLTKGIQQTS